MVSSYGAGVDEETRIAGKAAVVMMEENDGVASRARFGEVVEGEERDGALGQRVTENSGR